MGITREMVSEIQRLEQRLSDALQAVGLLSTLAGDVVMDPDNLVGMAQEIVASVEKSRATAEQRGAERERWECFMIATANARCCGGTLTSGDKSQWNSHDAHSDAHDACHEDIEIGISIAARGRMRGPEE